MFLAISSRRPKRADGSWGGCGIHGSQYCFCGDTGVKTGIIRIYDHYHKHFWYAGLQLISAAGRERGKPFMSHNVYLYILVMAIVTYLIRMLPLLLQKKRDQKPVYQVLSVLCAICLSGSHDLPGHPEGHRQHHLRCSRFPG